MLTLLETTNAIKALDTDPSVIAAACRKVLGLDKTFPPTEKSVGHDILTLFENRLPQSEFLSAIAALTGVVGGGMAKIGRSREAFSDIVDIMREAFVVTSGQKFADLIQKDPAQGLDYLMKALSELSEAEVKDRR